MFFFLHKCISRKFFILPAVFYTKIFNTARIPTEINKICFTGFSFVKNAVSFVKLLNISLNEYSLFSVI